MGKIKGWNKRFEGHKRIVWETNNKDKELTAYWSGAGYSVILESRDGNIIFRSPLYKTFEDAKSSATRYMRTHPRG